MGVNNIAVCFMVVVRRSFGLSSLMQSGTFRMEEIIMLNFTWNEDRFIESTFSNELNEHKSYPRQREFYHLVITEHSENEYCHVLLESSTEESIEDQSAWNAENDAHWAVSILKY